MSCPCSESVPVGAGKPYALYLLECAGGRYYAGIARDVEDRFRAHTNGKGAKFTRAWAPIRILASKLYDSQGDALRAEILIKRLPRSKKIRFFSAAELRA